MKSYKVFISEYDVINEETREAATVTTDKRRFLTARRAQKWVENAMDYLIDNGWKDLGCQILSKEGKLIDFTTIHC